MDSPEVITAGEEPRPQPEKSGGAPRGGEAAATGQS